MGGHGPLSPQAGSEGVLDFNKRQKWSGSERTFVVDSVFKAKCGKNNSLSKGVPKASGPIDGFFESGDLLNKYNSKNLRKQFTNKCAKKLIGPSKNFVLAKKPDFPEKIGRGFPK
jgi:hypothetical protein